MAAIVSPWAKPGAWALDSEEHEAELLAETQQNQNGHPTSDFPSLAAAAAKPKKKKGQTISLAEFSTYGGPKPPAVSTQPAGLTHEDLLILPTGPRERTAEELDRSRLGGGFRNYGSNGSYDRSNRYSNSDDSSNSRWGSSRASDETRRSNGGFGKEFAREAATSRADEIDNWAAGKRPIVSNGFEKRDKGWFSDTASSKADESDSWVSSKSFIPSETRKFSSNGSFDRERRGGFTSNGAGVDSDKWGKKEGTIPRSVCERPRLNLQPRTLPLSNDGKPEVLENMAKPKGSNPFGEARPREEVLAGKGQDWKKIDEQFGLMKVKDAENVEKLNGDSHWKRSSNNGISRLSEDRAERTWRKPDSVETHHPKSAESTEDEAVEEI